MKVIFHLQITTTNSHLHYIINFFFFQKKHAVIKLTLFLCYYIPENSAIFDYLEWSLKVQMALSSAKFFF